MFRSNCTRTFLFLPLRSQWMKRAFCDHLENSLITIFCRHVTNTFDDCPVAATVSLSPSFIASLRLLVFLFLACKLFRACLFFCTEFNSANNGILSRNGFPIQLQNIEYITPND